MPEASFDELLATAHALADQSASAILPHFRAPLAVVDKAKGGGFDPVTVADREAEAVIRRELARRHPEHGILGEEHANTAHNSLYEWVIDPIDGTRAFIMGLPLWGTLIGLTRAGVPLLGVMNQPYTGERFWSTADGALMSARGRAPVPMHTRSCATLADAILACTTPEMFRPGAERAAFDRVAGAARMTRFGGDCYAYCMLAMGYADIVVEAGLKPFDIAALIPIIEGAGGRVTGWRGEPALEACAPGLGGRIVAAGDAALHASVLEVLAA
jgi:myo-inositol-1(or 4)-monophosphatase